MGRSRKTNIDGVNLIKVYYMHVVNIRMKPLFTIYVNKNNFFKYPKIFYLSVTRPRLLG
jgi:hypothetical protein